MEAGYEPAQQPMHHPGWTLVIIGALIAVVGLAWLFAPANIVPGRLPGDVVIERGSFRFYFPLATCILLSVMLTGIMWVVRYFSR